MSFYESRKMMQKHFLRLLPEIHKTLLNNARRLADATAS